MPLRIWHGADPDAGKRHRRQIKAPCRERSGKKAGGREGREGDSQQSCYRKLGALAQGSLTFHALEQRVDRVILAEGDVEVGYVGCRTAGIACHDFGDIREDVSVQGESVRTWNGQERGMKRTRIRAYSGRHQSWIVWHAETWDSLEHGCDIERSGGHCGGSGRALRGGHHGGLKGVLSVDVLFNIAESRVHLAL